jgi:predicted ATPase/DNA-binding CsgD family transcriptional regulator
MRTAGGAELMLPRSRFFGRDGEIFEVRHLLEFGERLVTVTGPGGIGKTRVALQVCGKLSGQVAFIRLDDTDGPTLEGALLRALAPGASDGSRPVQAIAQALAGEPWVVVLDTFEHLTREVSLLDDLLSACPDLQLLTTSRTRLRLDGERVVSLSALPTGIDGPAVDLFLERAAAVGGASPSTNSAAPRQIIADLCVLLDGSPLAIELAAARTTLFSPEALLAGLLSGHHSRLQMLARGHDDNPPRQLDMRSAIEWSYLLLDESAQTVLRRLAVFPGSFHLEAAAFVCLGPEADAMSPTDNTLLDDLAALVDIHLVDPAGGPVEAPRFRLLDVLREFADERLRDADELDLVQNRLLSWCLEFSARAEAGLRSADERAWLAAIAVELPTITHVLRLLHARGDAARGVQIASDVAWFWAHRGPMAEGRRWFTAFLALDGGQPSLTQRERAVATSWSARMAIDEGDLDVSALEIAREILHEEGAADDWLQATEHLAYGLTLRGELDRADELTAAGVDVATEAGLPYWLCIFLLRKALSALRHSDPVSASRDAQLAVRTARELGLERVVARAQQVDLQARGSELSTEEMRVTLLDNLTAHEHAGDLRGVASTQAGLGSVVAGTDNRSAAGWYLGGIETAHGIGYWHGEAYCVIGVIALLAGIGRDLDAARLAGAMQKHLPVMKAGLPPADFAGYLAALNAVATRLGAEAFEQAAQELPRDWASIRTTAETLAREVAGAMGRAEPHRHRRGPVPNDGLSDRELQVLGSIAQGKTNPQIAAELCLSSKTVMHHSTTIYRKLGVRGRAEAVALAYRTGLL